MKNKYEGKDSFCLTRHPYSRLVSEYAYALAVLQQSSHHVDAEDHRHHHPRSIFMKPPCTAEGLNYFIQESLREYFGGQKYLHNCHFLPQSDYIWGPNKTWCR